MPKAVAILEGDSSSLVKSIDDAKGAMTKMDKEARKLSDQIRDVADEADKAAGALVNKIGGPTAVKAIAGIGAAFAGAQIALGALSASMSSFYSTQGKEGADAMAKVDTAISTLSGSLFEAATGGASAKESADLLVGGLTSLKTAVDVILFPFGQLVKLITQAATDGNEAAKASKQMAIAEAEFNAQLNASATNMANNADAVGEVHKQYLAIFGTKKEMAIFDAQEDIRRLVAVRRELEANATKLKMAQDVMAGDRGAAVQAQKERTKYIADTLKEYPNIRQATIEGMADAFIKSDEGAIARIDAARSAALARSALLGTRGILEMQGALKYYDELGALIENQNKNIDKLKALGDKAFEATNPRTRRTPAVVAAAPAAGEPAAPELSPWEKQKQEMDAYYAEAAKKQQEADAKAYADGINAVVTRARAEEAAKAAEEKAAKDKKLADEQADYDARKAMAMDLFQVKAKLLVQEMAIGKNGFKVMADMARKAIGDAISAKGDEAMAQAAIYAAAFNPQAIPMAAAGVAAYAAAAMLGSSAKKSTSSTPAAAAPVQAAPVNTSFNLRVDAAFADGESIARQFAMMQRNAQARGLVPVGA